jgi:hypothetical protein
MWPFTRALPLGRELMQYYAGMFEACGIPEAKRTAKDLLALAKKQACSDPDLPPDFGNLLLEREATDNSTKQMLAAKRAEGVTDADIRWWWGLGKLERRMLIVVDEWFRMAAFLKHEAEGMSEEQATSELRKSFPILGDPQDTENVKGDDRPLPFELKDRINEWALRNERGELASELRRTTSMNALIRSEIKAGRL